MSEQAAGHELEKPNRNRGLQAERGKADWVSRKWEEEPEKGRGKWESPGGEEGISFAICTSLLHIQFQDNLKAMRG